MKYFVHFSFSGGSGFMKSGTGRTIVEVDPPISTNEELAALEEEIAEEDGFGSVQIINLQELST